MSKNPPRIPPNVGILIPAFGSSAIVVGSGSFVGIGALVDRLIVVGVGGLGVTVNDGAGLDGVDVATGGAVVLVGCKVNVAAGGTVVGVPLN